MKVIHRKDQDTSLQFNCGDCPFQGTTDLELSKHVHQAHSQQVNKPTHISCWKCKKEFLSQSQLSRHIKVEHEEHRNKNLEFNCDDCPYQGSSRSELRKHVKITKHCPSSYIETCYTCKNEFPTYWDLMNHRKKEHPSKRVCRYFKEGTCIFEDEECWWNHFPKNEQSNLEIFSHPCQQCDTFFKTQTELLKHKKIKHSSTSSKCWDFMNGTCELSENSCLFRHEEQSMEVDYQTEQVFQETKEKKAPDQLDKMMNMINKLRQEILEMKMLKN